MDDPPRGSRRCSPGYLVDLGGVIGDGRAENDVATRSALVRENSLVHELIASPFLEDYLVLRPGSTQGVKIPGRRYRELRQVAAGEVCPGWLVESVRRRWGLDLSGRSLSETVLVRRPSPYGYGRASYELNLGCNYDCEHCYLGLKQFEGLSWPDRERLLHLLCEAGVLWLQLTGGEPLIDKLLRRCTTWPTSSA